MKELEEKTLEEIVESGSKEELDQYYSYLESMKTTAFYKDIVERYEGLSIAEITYKIMEEEQEYISDYYSPGDFIVIYPRIREQRARDYITCDFSAGIIYPGSLYINYRPLIRNVTSGETYVLSKTLKVETGHGYDLPTTIRELESLNYKIMMDTDHDNTGIHYSHLSQRVGGEIQLQKLKRRRKNENRHSK